MRALLLAAGLGTRLRPLTETVPKCLVPIHGKPLLDYWLEHLFDAGIERVLINLHWLPDVVRAHVAASPWNDRIDLVHERESAGHRRDGPRQPGVAGRQALPSRACRQSDRLRRRGVSPPA